MTSKGARNGHQQRGDRSHGGILACAILAFASFSPSCPAAEGEGGLQEAVANGRFNLELRPRYNRLEESDTENPSRGYTYRAVAGWRSAPWLGLRLTVEGIHADHIG